MYRKLAYTVFRTSTVYRFNLLTSIFATLISVFAIRQVWNVLYGQTNSTAISGWTLGMMLTYATVAMLIQSVYGPSIVWEISRKIQTGEIVQDFQRPWDFQMAMFARSIGLITAGLLTVAVPIAVVTVLFFHIEFPSNPLIWLAFLLSIALGVLINFSLQFFLGLLSFVFVEIWGFEIVLSLTISFLSGKMIPLTFFPEALQKGVQYLPFRGLYDIPISIFTGQVAVSDIPQLLGFQAIWALGLIVLIRVMIRYFERLLVVAGG